MDLTIENVIMLILFDFISYYSFKIVFDTIYQRKLKLWLFLLLCVLQTAASMFVSFFAPQFNIAAAIIIWFIFSLFYSRKILKNIFTVLILEVITAALELFSYYFFAYLFHTTVNGIIADTALSICTQMFLRMLYLLAALSFRRYALGKKQSSELNNRSWLICLIFALLSLYVFYCICEITRNHVNFSFLTLIAIFIILSVFNILIFFQIDKISEYYRLKKENDDISQYLQLQESEMQQYKKYNEKIQTMSHDLKHEYNLFTILLQEKKYDELEATIASKLNLMEQSKNYISTKDSFLDALVNFKIANAEKSNIQVKTELMISDIVPIEHDKLSVIIGNVFDNAIEHCSKHPAPILITVIIKYIGNVFILEVKNPVDKPVQISENMSVKTSKDDHFHHGFGLRSIISTVHSLNGIFKITCTDTEFTAAVSIITKEENTHD